MGSGARVMVACHDLLFRSKVEATLRHMGLDPWPLRRVDDPAAALASERPAAVIVDLGLGPDHWRAVVAAARAAQPPIPLLAFGPHVDHATLAEARAAGCDLVVANSRLARELPALVERLVGSG